MLYAYCVVDEHVQVVELPTGLDGAEIKAIQNNGLVALVSEFAGDAASITRENVMSHDALVGRVLLEVTPLPFRFGTLASHEQIISFLNSREKALKVKLEEVRNSVEMSVKVIWTPLKTDTASFDVADETDSPGAAFLKAKRREILGDEALVDAAKQLSLWLHDKTSQFVSAEDVAIRPSQKLVVAASHLVERSRIEDYQQAVKQAVDERPDLHFLVSGPWAPYSFVNINLEFKTHFGVS
jgi:hypothetical protein